MKFWNQPAERVQECCHCGKRRVVHSYWGEDPTKPVCIRCAPLLAKITRILMEVRA